MRTLLAITSLALISGCSSFMPSHDPEQAWVELDTVESSDLRASKVDDKTLEDDRFFQVSPGNHALEAQLHFNVDAANVGNVDQPLQRSCKLMLKYPDFAAGETYRLEAGHYGFRPWAKLYDAQDYVVSVGREGSCGQL